MAGPRLAGSVAATGRVAVSGMTTGPVVVTHTFLAPGVIAFAWTAEDDRGDGLLVDVDVAAARWLEVADVLVRWSAASDRPSGGAGDWSTELAAVVTWYRAVLARCGGGRSARELRTSSARRRGTA